MKFTLADENAVTPVAAALATLIQPGFRLYLHGDLGAGKTTLARAILRALGETGPVKSPTYALVELYVFSGYILHHFDFYRFSDPEEWFEAGLDEAFNADDVCLVEWPEKAGDLLPIPDLRLRLTHAGIGRELQIEATSTRGQQCLDSLKTRLT
jgi:tRNA threonylcarbamoyladenosine biosynthesis protein TsaE